MTKTDASSKGNIYKWFLPIPAFVVLMMGTFLTVDPSMFYDPAWLILAGNTFFVTVVSLVVSYIAMKNYSATGRIQILMLGCGVLIFGIGGFLAAIVRGLPDGANLNVTVYNIGALLGAAFHFVAAFILLAGVSSEVGFKQRRGWLFFGYAASAVLMVIITAASVKGMMPVFFVQGVGPTLLRQLVLGAADVMFVFSFIVFLGTYLRNKELFLYWYSCALALTAISLTVFFIQSSVGSPVGWVGRISQYVGGAYFIASLITAGRTAQSRGTSLDNVLTESLSGVEEKFRALAENVPDVIRRFDRELNQIYVNAAALRLYDKPASDIIGRPLEDAGLPEGLCKLWNERVRKVFETGQPVEVEDYLPTEKGMAFYQSQLVPELGPEGAVANVLIVSRDLTEHKQAEERLRTTLESIGDGFFACDADWRFVYINTPAERILGIGREEALGKSHWEVFPLTLGTSLEREYRRAAAGEVRDFENFYEPWRRWFHNRCFPREGGGVTVYFEDITHRKKAEGELRETKDYLESLIDYANAPIIVWDTRFTITRFNHAFELLTGLQATEAIGKQLEILFPEESKEDSLEHIRRTLSGERWDVVEIPILRADGSIRTVLWNSANIYDPKRTAIVATLAQGQDITERKLAEERLRKARDELELRVQERTAELFEAKEELEVINEELRNENDEHLKLEEELRVARDAAEAAAWAKADFMANMSHEIRTPMNAVIGMTSILLEEQLTPEQKDYIETIRNSGNALLVIINDILDFSRLDREKAELEEQFFDLRTLVEEALDQVALKAAEKGLNLAYIMAKDVPETVYSDPARLRQVLLNILNNAVKFTEKGDVLLSVGQAPAGVRHEIRFSVQDTGIGISQEQQKDLFQPFAQADTSLARNYEGVGLGLAISKKLIELMGGKIQIKSEPGKESNILFSIMAKVLPDEPKTIPSGEQPALRGKGVLIIENNKINRMILGRLTIEWGMNPLLVEEAKEAVSYLTHDEAFDAVILGSKLLDEDGTLARSIREIGKKIPVIQLVPIGTKAKEDFIAVLPLPIKPQQLYDSLINSVTKAPLQEKVPLERQDDAGPLRILLAEDNVSSQKVTLQMLKKLCFRADLAANGQEAVEALKRQHYDLVLMDVKMPVMNGWDAAREIRRLWPENGPKIIALTAYALAGDKEKCLKAGMDGYLAKPVAMEDLKNVLNVSEDTQVK
jgi:PAS domain S-box-containing protein